MHFILALAKSDVFGFWAILRYAHLPFVHVLNPYISAGCIFHLCIFAEAFSFDTSPTPVVCSRRQRIFFVAHFIFCRTFWMEGHRSQFSRLHVVDLNLIHVSPLSSFYNSEAFIGISKVTQKKKRKEKFCNLRGQTQLFLP